MKKGKFLILLGILIILASFAAAQEMPPGLMRLNEYNNQLASNVNILIALLAGFISFTSPCGFALLPAFFTFLFKERKRAVLMTSAFALGLTIAFAIFGFIAALFGEFFNSIKLNLAVASGYLLMFFGAMLFLNKGFSVFNFLICNLMLQGSRNFVRINDMFSCN